MFKLHPKYIGKEFLLPPAKVRVVLMGIQDGNVGKFQEIDTKATVTMEASDVMLFNPDNKPCSEITMREFFACSAMQAILSRNTTNFDLPKLKKGETYGSWVVDQSVYAADLLIKKLNSPS